MALGRAVGACDEGDLGLMGGGCVRQGEMKAGG